MLRLRDAVAKGGRLPQEKETGNVEYKLILHDYRHMPDRLEHYISQLQYRLAESGKCYYMLGVDDDGTIKGVSPVEHQVTIKTLQKMVECIGGTVASLDQVELGSGLIVAEAQIVTSSSSDSASSAPISEVAVGVVGPVSSGKSTLIGVLCQGALDNGNGSARMLMLKHRHELLSGHTHSTCFESLLFRSLDPLVTATPPIQSSHDFSEPMSLREQQQRLSAFKTVHFIDTPGVPVSDADGQGSRSPALLTNNQGPDHLMIVVDAHAGISHSLLEFLEMAVMLGYTHDRIFFCLTKTDLCANPSRSLALPSPLSSSPVFEVSSVTGHGLGALREHLLGLEPAPRTAPVETAAMCVEHVFVGRDVGLIVRGRVASCAALGPGGFLLGPLGPDSAWQEVEIESVHRLRVPVKHAVKGQYVTLSLQEHCGVQVEKGMFLLPLSTLPQPRQMAIKKVVRSKGFKAQLGFVSGLPAKPLPVPTLGLLLVNGTRIPCQLTQESPSGLYGILLREPSTVYLGSNVVFATDMGRLCGTVAML